MTKVIETIWNILLLGVSLGCLGLLSVVTLVLAKSALDLNKTGLISLTSLSHSLQSGHVTQDRVASKAKRPETKKMRPSRGL